jgi:hypothetical protein
MNSIDVRAVPIHGQFIARFKRVHKAEYETVQENGEPVLFPTSDKAKLAGWEAMTAHLTSLMRRDGCTIEAREAAEAIFTRKSNGIESRAQAQDGHQAAAERPALSSASG